MAEITFHPFQPGDAPAFRELNEDWIREFFTLEEKDHEVLGDPAKHIVTKGGAIVMAKLRTTEGSRAVGCCALIAMGEGSFELAKMTIAAEHRGQGIGRKFLGYVIEHARGLGMRRLYLETNRKLENAIHLYEAAGFRHVPVERLTPSPYTRADVFMELFLDERLSSLDLETYAARVGYRGSFAPTLETLRELHLAHATTIPFENLDILLGRPIRIDLKSVFGKLVQSGRGGYCYEHNTLFAAVLEAAGFRVTRLGARVRMGYRAVRPRTHMLLGVRIGEETWLADVGFGGEGLLHPLPMRPGEIARHFDWTYRVIEEGPVLVLQSLHPEGWFDLYAFTLDEQFAADYEVANHYVSTYPSSRFVRLLLAQKPGIESRLTLANRRLTEQKPSGASETVLPDDAAILDVLSSRFDLRFPAGTRFPFQESD